MSHRAMDFDELHRLLWSRSDRLHTVRIESQVDLAAELGLSTTAMHRTLHAFIRDERIRKASTRSVVRGRFIVTDPDEWQRNRSTE